MPPEKRPAEMATTVIGITILFLLFVFFIVVLILQFQRRRNQHALEMARLKQTYAEELLKSQLEIQEQTFRSISQEIHDNIGQVLSLAKLNVGVMGQQVGAMPMIDDTRELLTKAINDLRNLSKGLSPERVADIDLAESVGYELELLGKTGLFTTALLVSGSMYPLPKEKKIILFPIFQELMNNVVKHSAASHIEVKLDYGETIFGLTVTDNGRGFDVSGTEGATKGIGLSNMENRSQLIGANFHIQSAAGIGTTVSVLLPVT